MMWLRLFFPLQSSFWPEFCPLCQLSLYDLFVCRDALASDSTLLEAWTTARTTRQWPWSPAQGECYIYSIGIHLFDKCTCMCDKSQSKILLLRCDQPIKDASVLVNQKPYHPTCFSCSTCQKPIGEIDQNTQPGYLLSFFSRRKVLHGARREILMRARLPANQGEMWTLQTSSPW